MYLAAKDAGGKVWGGPPCTRCTVELIQAGIAEIVSYPSAGIPTRWLEDIEFARTVLSEAGVVYREVDKAAGKVDNGSPQS